MEFFAKEGRYDFPDISTSVSLASLRDSLSAQRAIFPSASKQLARRSPVPPNANLPLGKRESHQWPSLAGVDSRSSPAAC